MKTLVRLKLSIIFCVVIATFFITPTISYGSINSPIKNPLDNYKIKSSRVYPIDIQVDTGDSDYIKTEYVSIFVEVLTEEHPSLGSVDKNSALLFRNDKEKYFKAFEEKIFNPFLKKKIIPQYVKFVKNHPKSSLVAEAKLKIAEFHIMTRESWKAKKWLDSIINNHSEDEYFRVKPRYTEKGKGYAGFDLVPTGQHTAAWALFYRAFQFPNNPEFGWRKDLTTILTKYKNSTDACEEARSLYKYFEEKERRQELKKLKEK